MNALLVTLFVNNTTTTTNPRKNRDKFVDFLEGSGIEREFYTCLKCPCGQKINFCFSLDFKTMLAKH